MLLGIVCLLGGCLANVLPDAYSVDSVGQVNCTMADTIVSARNVHH